MSWAIPYLVVAAGSQGYLIYKHVFVHHTAARRIVWLIPGFSIALILLGLVISGVFSEANTRLAGVFGLLAIGVLAIAYAIYMVLGPEKTLEKMVSETDALADFDERAKQRAEAKQYGYHALLLKDRET